ncbi:PREDICTED: uncharacterized protein LOC108777656 [Cyphomyrmex costatus]|uniref:uncharacterized protein LOC108777656 n=1 Tax=Cyphomyrmex costatus TaxID=456900 RepID=UPI0008523643|nr:PREDICTED: uncharacterized protein LOC108777656 [Cyphomyrmex costatus]
MKIPFLILSLAVVYSICQTYDEENDVVKALQNNEDYKNYANMPFERFSARYKRTILSSTTYPIDTLLSLLGVNGARSSVRNVITFATELLSGNRNICSKVDKLSLATIPKCVTNPIEAIESVICYVTETIATTSNEFFDKAFNVIFYFIKCTGLPSLRKLLNAINYYIPLPSQFQEMIGFFNTMYDVGVMLGWFPDEIQFSIC